jgi:hypothetical protein
VPAGICRLIDLARTQQGPVRLASHQAKSQQTWVDDRLGELQQAALVERAGQGRYRLGPTSAPGPFAGGAG